MHSIFVTQQEMAQLLESRRQELENNQFLIHQNETYKQTLETENGELKRKLDVAHRIIEHNEETFKRQRCSIFGGESQCSERIKSIGSSLERVTNELERAQTMIERQHRTIQFMHDQLIQENIQPVQRTLNFDNVKDEPLSCVQETVEL